MRTSQLKMVVCGARYPEYPPDMVPGTVSAESFPVENRLLSVGHVISACRRETSAKKGTNVDEAITLLVEEVMRTQGVSGQKDEARTQRIAAPSPALALALAHDHPPIPAEPKAVCYETDERRVAQGWPVGCELTLVRSRSIAEVHRGEGGRRGRCRRRLLLDYA